MQLCGAVSGALIPGAHTAELGGLFSDAPTDTYRYYSGQAPLPTHRSAREHETISVPSGIIHVGEHDTWVRRMFACVIWCRTR
jgi:hypothetical protein